MPVMTPARAWAGVRRDPLVAAAYALLIACGVELAWRQLARRSLMAWADANGLPSPMPVLTAAACAAAMGLLAVWWRRRHEETSAALVDRVVRVTLVTAFVVGLAAQQHLGSRLQSDGFFYFAYLRSLAFDRDVDLANDYRLIGVGADRPVGSPTQTGYAHTAWSIGPAMLWSPFFAAGHGVARGLASAGAPVATDGTSFPYRQAVCIGTLFYGLLGLWFAYRLTARFFAPVVAAWAAALVGLGSFLVWYAVKEPTMSHVLSMAAVAAFLWAWLAGGPDRRLGWWGLIGVLAGLMVAVRWQNLVFLAVPAFDVAVGLWRGPHASRRPLAIGAAVATAAALIAFLPQAAAWQAIYGSPLAVSPLSPKMHWANPQVVLTLWSSRNGLFATSPVAYVGALGLLLFAWRDRRFGLRALALFALSVYVNSVVDDWWGGAAYGARRFDGAIPLLIVGMAAAIDTGRAWLVRRPLTGIVAVLSLLVVWNLTAMGAALRGTYDIANPRSFGRVAAEQARTLHGWIGHPFSYPLNLWHAARGGMSPARWDELAFAFLSDPAQPNGRVDVGLDDEAYVGDGWHAPERAADGRTSRWTSRSAELLMALDHAAPLLVQVRLAPFTYPGAPARPLRVLINGRAFGPFALAGDWQRLDVPTDARDWRAGVNRVRFESLSPDSPARAGISGDTRELGVAVDYVRVEAIR